MDSITQAVLGASVATAVAPKGHRKRAMLTGALLGTLPDLDVFITYETAVDGFTYHRGWSHSLLILPFVAMLLTPLLKRFFDGVSIFKLFLMTLLPLVTHPILDALTAYGTQLFYPIPVTPTYLSSIFIIDPLYTIWLLLGVLVYYLNAKFKWVNHAGLLVSTAYLALGLGLQQVALNQLAIAYPDTQKHDWFVTPVGATPFCWHGVLVRDDVADAEYIETLFNVQKPSIIAEQRYDILPATAHPNSKDWARLTWFNPNTVLRDLNDEDYKDTTFISSDLRMGELGQYVFQFSFDENGKNNIKDKDIFEDFEWQPKSQNKVAEQYAQLTQGQSRATQKIKQLGRCLAGRI